MPNWWRRKRREVLIPDNLPSHVIATCVNGGYAKCGLLENWAQSLQRLGLERQVVIAALDDEADAVARELPGFVLRFETEETPKPVTVALRYRKEGWKPVVFSKLALVRQLLQSGRHVLFSDSDVVFRRNPLQWFPGEGKADFAAQSDAPANSKSDTPGSLCSGLYFAHPTREAMETLRFTTGDLERHGGDQDFLRKRLGQERMARCLMLPRELFPNGNVWKNTPPPDPVAVHFNWVEGVEAKLHWIRECRL
jgi:hypothetical protein